MVIEIYGKTPAKMENSQDCLEIGNLDKKIRAVRTAAALVNKEESPGLTAHHAQILQELEREKAGYLRKVFPRLTNREWRVIRNVFPGEYPVKRFAGRIPQEVFKVLDRTEFEEVTVFTANHEKEFLLVGWKRVGFHENEKYRGRAPYRIARWGNSLRPWNPLFWKYNKRRVFKRSAVVGTLIFASTTLFFGLLPSFLLGVTGGWFSYSTNTSE